MHQSTSCKDEHDDILACCPWSYGLGQKRNFMLIWRCYQFLYGFLPNNLPRVSRQSHLYDIIVIPILANLTSIDFLHWQNAREIHISENTQWNTAPRGVNRNNATWNLVNTDVGTCILFLNEGRYMKFSLVLLFYSAACFSWI